MTSVTFPTDVRHVAFAGDWHANYWWALRMLKHLPVSVDVVVHTGDFGYRFDAAFLDLMQDAAEQTHVTIMFVDGNHEDFDRLLAFPIDPATGVRVLRPNVWHLPRGFRWTWQGLRFLALGGASSIDKAWRKPGRSWWAQELITDDDVSAAVRGGLADVMICHDTPSGYDIPGLLPPGTIPSDALAVAEAHRTVLRRVVDVAQPALLIHGHYHSQYTRTVPLRDRHMTVVGLDCDETTYEQNIAVVDLAQTSELISDGRPAWVPTDGTGPQ